MGKNFALALAGFGVLVVSAALINSGLDQVAQAAQDQQSAQQVEGDSQTHTVRPGENLFRIAELYYGDPSHWQLIADANQIGTPSALQAGASIKIPVLPEVVAPLPTVAQMPETGPQQDAPTLDTLIGQDALGVTEFPEVEAEKQLYAVVNQVESGFSLRFIESSPQKDQVIAEEIFDTQAHGFRFLYTLDADGDGVEEVYTVWNRGDDNYYTRVYALDGNNQPRLLEVVPNDSYAMAWEASNQASMEQSAQLGTQ